MGSDCSVEEKDIQDVKNVDKIKMMKVIEDGSKYNEINIDYENEKFLNFPTDCIGLIMDFVTSSKDVCNVELTCKTAYHYLTKEFPICCRNARFKMRKKPKYKKMNCYRLTINRSDFKFESKDSEEVINDDFQLFPNITHLFLNGVKINNITNCKITSECFKYLPNLVKLDVENIPCLKDDDFKYIPNLRNLRIRYESQSLIPPHIMNSINENPEKEIYLSRNCPDGYFLKYLPKLEVLKLSDINSVLKHEHFQSYPPRKLRKLVIWRTNGILSFLKHLKDLEHFEMFDCYRPLPNIFDRNLREIFLKEQFGSLTSKLVFLSIRDCVGFGSEDTSYSSSKEFLLKKCLKKEIVENENFVFIYKPKELRPGGIRPLRLYN